MSTRINQNSGSGNLNAAQLIGNKQGSAETKSVEKNKTSHKKSVQVKLSNQALEAQTAKQKALDIALNTPDVRMDKVEEFKAKIKNGEYKVDPELVAEGIVREALREDLALNPIEL